MKTVASVVLLACLLTACSTYESTHVAADSGDGCYDGVPITVEKPRYLKVTYAEVPTLWPLRDRSLSAQERTELLRTRGAADTNKIDRRRGGFRWGGTQRTVETEIVPISEVFTVDVKRPLAGTATYSITWPVGRQFPEAFSATIEDQSLEQLVALAEAFKAQIDARDKGDDTRGDGESTSGDFRSAAVVKLQPVVTRIEYYDLLWIDCHGAPRLVKVIQAKHPGDPSYGG